MAAHRVRALGLQAGLHTLVAKPLVKTLAHHRQLVELAQQHNVLVSRTLARPEGGAWVEGRGGIAHPGSTAQRCKLALAGERGSPGSPPAPVPAPTGRGAPGSCRW